MGIINEFLAIISECFLFFLHDDFNIQAISRWSVPLYVSGILIVSGLIAGFFYKSPSLWNTKMNIHLFHRLLTAFVFVLTFIFMSSFFSLTYLHQTTVDLTENWQKQLPNDKAWQYQTFSKTYQAVKAQGEEDFSNYPPPEQGGKLIPENHEASRRITAKTYVTEAIEHFKQRHPYLSKILKTDLNIPEEEIYQDSKSFFDKKTGKNYELENAITITGDKLKKGFDQRIPNLIKTTRFFITVAYVAIMTLLFAGVGFIAYRDIKIFC